MGLTLRAADSNRFNTAIPDVTYPATLDSAARSRTPASISGAIASITPFGSSRANAAIASGAVDQEKAVVAQDLQDKNYKQAIADTQTLITLMKAQEATELAIVDAKIKAVGDIAGEPTFIAWTTGGALLPDAEFDAVIARGRMVNAARAVE